METIKCDVCIVGGGPAGCTTALYTSRSALRTVIVDKNPDIGALAVTGLIANYPGVKGDGSGKELLDMMRGQAEEYGADYVKAQVFMIGVDDDEEDEDGGVPRRMVYTPDAVYSAKSIVLATGAMGRPPGFKGEGEYLGKGVSYCATCDGAFYVDEEVAVVGVGKEAVDEALYLTKFAKTVHWLTQGEGPTDEDAMELKGKENVKHWPKTRLVEVLGDGMEVKGVNVKVFGNDSEQVIDVTGCFIYVAGSKPITDFIQSSKIKLNPDGGVWVDEEMSTTVPGVYAIGDIRNTPFKQVVVAASDGCVAAMAIEKYIKGRKKVRVDWVHE